LLFRRIPGKFRLGIPTGASCMAEKQWMTYSQIAERLGVTPDAIRHRSRKEGWQRQEGNDSKIRVLIDPELLSENLARSSADSAPESDRNSGHDSERSDREVRRLEDQVQELRRQMDQQRTDYREDLARQRTDHAAELERLRDELNFAQVEAQKARDAADKAKAEQLQMALDFSEKHAEMHADRARLQVELEQARRRWWHRWFKR
jgi:predicted transcriptional regulator